MRLTVYRPPENQDEERSPELERIEEIRNRTKEATYAIVTAAADAVEIPAEVISYLSGRTAGGVKRVFQAAQKGWNAEPLRKAA